MKKLNEELEKALKQKETESIKNHPSRVRKLANEYFSKNNVDSTPQIKINGYEVIFHRSPDSSTDNISITVNSTHYSSKSDVDRKILEIDFGKDNENSKKQHECSDKIKNKVKNIGRITKIDLTRKIISEPVNVAKSMNSEGQGLIMSLLKLLGRTISKASQSR